MYTPKACSGCIEHRVSRGRHAPGIRGALGSGVHAEGVRVYDEAPSGYGVHAKKACAPEIRSAVCGFRLDPLLPYPARPTFL